LIVTGSLKVLGSITGSLLGTASFVTGSIHTAGNLALSSSYTVSSSFAQTAQTASYVVTAQTASFVTTAQTASFVTGSIYTAGNLALSSSYALSASYAPGGAGGTTFPYTGSAQITGSLGVTGSVTATSVIETSALRYKQNIQNLESIDGLYKLRAVSFDWKSTLKSDIGFIAEEVNEILPVLAEINEDGQAEGVKYSKLTAILTKALQIHDQRLKDHDQRLKDQQKQIDELKQEINHLKNK